MKFSGTNIGFEIPRILAASDIALRLLHTRYDHVTPLCPTAFAEEAEEAEEVLQVTENVGKKESTEKVAAPEEKEKAEEITDDQVEQPEITEEQEISIIVEEEIKNDTPEYNDIPKVGYSSACLSAWLSVAASWTA